MNVSPTRKAALWVGVVFVLGVLLGGAGGYALGRHSHRWRFERSGNEAARHAQRVDQITRMLDLSPAQRQQMDEILTDFEGQMKAIRKQAQPQISQVRQKGRERIMAILTPEQKPKFEEFLKKLDEERRRREQ
ncbi:MAG: hypothetical protein NVS9B4_12490 [Candidatus Acidiferrum sp.]